MKELVATLTGKIESDMFKSCVEAGMTRARIHGAKTSPEEAVKLIGLCRANGIFSSFDTPGKKGRVLQSDGMFQVSDGLEKGNWLKVLTPRELMCLIEDDKYAVDGLFNCKLTCIPRVFSGNGNERINFADGKITCTVKKVLPEAILVEVTSIRDTEGLFWKMGVNSDTTDLFSGDGPVLTQTDIKNLAEVKQLLASDSFSEEIALSFVSTGEQIKEAQKIIEDLGIKATTLAKIETVRGVKNIEEIVALTNVEVARGDLEEACKVDGTVNLSEAERAIIDAANRANRKVIIATHVADSLWNKIKSGGVKDDERLTKSERVNVCIEYPISDGFMLAAETMTTGKNAIQVIKSTNQAIRVAKRYWQIYGGFSR